MQSAASSARTTDRRRSLSPIMEYQPKLIRDNSRSGIPTPAVGSLTGRNSISRKEIPASQQKQTEQEKGKDITKKDTKIVVTEEEKQKKIMQAKNQSRLRIIQKRNEEQ